MKKERKSWFKRRQNGYGWLPDSRQGWLVVFLWLLIVTGGVSWLNLVFENIGIAMGVSVIWCGFMLGILSAVASMKSDKPTRFKADGHQDS